MAEIMILRDEVRNSLNKANFQVYEENNSLDEMSFDLLARSNDVQQKCSPSLLIKILQNIDNIKPHFINEIKLISHLIAALPLFVAQENRHSALQSDSIYIRKDIIAVNLETFEKIINNPQTALALAFAKQGGFFHEVDGDKLIKLREKHGYSRKILAEKMDLTTKSISHYERNGMRTSMEKAELFQKILGDSVIKPLNFFEFLEETIAEINLNRKLQLKMAATRREFMKMIDEIIDQAGYLSFWPKGSPFDLCIYQYDDKEEKISEFTLIGGTDCENFPSNIDKFHKMQFLQQVHKDSAMIYEEETFDRKQAQKVKIPYIIPKELKKLENPKEFKKLIQKRRFPL